MTATTTYDPTEAQDYFAKKMTFSTGPVEVSHQIEANEDVNIIDVRAAEDYREGHVPGARNLPQDEWRSLKGLRRDTMNVLYCYSPTCHLAAKAAVQFAREGFPVMEMDGGFEVWKEKDLEIEK
jgi:Rhodanese-related sulfurtransferase